MGFGSNEQQQRLSFTNQTFAKIQFDMELFGEKHFATYINKIIYNYYPYAKSSIEIRLDSEREKIVKTLNSTSSKYSGSNIPLDNKEAMLYAILENKKEELYTYKDMLLSGSKTRSTKISLSLDVLGYLTDPCCQEVKHYSRKEYIECLIEEFVNLSVSEKEYYYYIDRIHTITEAINGSYQLKIKTNNGNIHYIKPYKLDSSNESSNYIIGYDVFDNINEYSEYAVSYRISSLLDIKPIRSKSGKLTKVQKKTLDEKLTINGPQFFSQDVEPIVVKFHGNGFEKYLRTAHLRPQYDKLSPKASAENGIYVFNCAPIHAEYYFIRLGADVEILEPEYLRDKFANIYSIGNALYN